jgi:hypothetical protein
VTGSFLLEHPRGSDGGVVYALSNFGFVVELER